MTTEITVQETDLYITVVPGHRIEFNFLRNPDMEALFVLEKLTRKYPSLRMHNLFNARYMLVGSKLHSLEQIAKEVKTIFESFTFSFTVKGQIDLEYHSVDL